MDVAPAAAVVAFITVAALRPLARSVVGSFLVPAGGIGVILADRAG